MKLVCFIDDWGFVHYDYGNDKIRFTYTIALASEAYEELWIDLMRRSNRQYFTLLQKKVENFDLT